MTKIEEQIHDKFYTVPKCGIFPDVNGFQQIINQYQLTAT